jgi:hypothetical protein
MATYHWNGGSGDWETTTDWDLNNGTFPGANDTAVISAPGTYTVTVSHNDKVNTLTLSTATATLAISNNNQFTVDGTAISNAGTIDLNSTGNNTFFVINSAGVSLSGGGAVTLTDQSTNFIEGAAAADVLTNVDNTISGAGQLGNTSLTLVNQSGGTINGSATTNPSYSPKIARSRGPGRDFARAAWPVDRVKR